MTKRSRIQIATLETRLLPLFMLLSSLLVSMAPPLEAGSESRRASARGSESHRSRMVILTDRAFKSRVFKSELPVLVEFGAPWCIGCRAAEPLLKKAAERFKGQAIIAKINTDRHSYWANKFRVDAIPTFLIFRDGKLVKRSVGMPDEGLLDRYLSSKPLIAKSPPGEPVTVGQVGR